MSKGYYIEMHCESDKALSDGIQPFYPTSG